MFYLVTKNFEQRKAIINRLKDEKISPVFHYLSLHSSPFYKEKHDERSLPYSDNYSDCLLRLPFFFELGENDIIRICNTLKSL